ncbi:unnamed protein product [Amoebophrya sp. A25]|nr:unnamed protein product [Amoebophrya sp. A25]|eukprot:GSA25T00027319001.1
MANLLRHFDPCDLPNSAESAARLRELAFLLAEEWDDVLQKVEKQGLASWKPRDSDGTRMPLESVERKHLYRLVESQLIQLSRANEIILGRSMHHENHPNYSMDGIILASRWSRGKNAKAIPMILRNDRLASCFLYSLMQFVAVERSGRRLLWAREADGNRYADSFLYQRLYDFCLGPPRNQTGYKRQKRDLAEGWDMQRHLWSLGIHIQALESVCETKKDFVSLFQGDWRELMRLHMSSATTELEDKVFIHARFEDVETLHWNEESVACQFDETADFINYYGFNNMLRPFNKEKVYDEKSGIFRWSDENPSWGQLPTTRSMLQKQVDHARRNFPDASEIVIIFNRSNMPGDHWLYEHVKGEANTTSGRGSGDNRVPVCFIEDIDEGEEWHSEFDEDGDIWRMMHGKALYLSHSYFGFAAALFRNDQNVYYPKNAMFAAFGLGAPAFDKSGWKVLEL